VSATSAGCSKGRTGREQLLYHLGVSQQWRTMERMVPKTNWRELCPLADIPISRLI
jgi:hypothetical protein